MKNKNNKKVHGFMVYASKDQIKELNKLAKKAVLSRSSYMVRASLGLPLEKYSVSIKNLIDSVPAIPE